MVNSARLRRRSTHSNEAAPRRRMAGAPPPEQHNWRIAQLYARNEFDECLAVVEKALTASNGLNEYPLYVKALITRPRGEIESALELFQAATCLNPSNVRNLKQVGHSLYLLGKHKAALGVYEQARSLSAELRKTRGEEKGEEKSSSRRSKGGDDWEDEMGTAAEVVGRRHRVGRRASGQGQESGSEPGRVREAAWRAAWQVVALLVSCVPHTAR